MKNQSKSNKKVLNISEIKQNIKKLYEIDKSLIPQYLDDLKQKNNKNKRLASSDNEFLKYM